jgi:uncharacterized protein
MTDTYNEILEYVLDLEIIDTHEHLPFCEDAREKPTDFLREYLYDYFSCDMFSSGLSREDFDKAVDMERPLMERWNLLEPYWENCRHTGYGRCLDLSVKGIYGVDRICRDTIEELDKLFQKSLNPGHFKKVLKEKSKIKISILDSNLDCDPEFFRSVCRLDIFVIPRTGEEIKFIEKETGIKICIFEDWLKACETFLDLMISKGAIALKSALAYLRPIEYKRVIRSDAEKDFLEIFKRSHFPDWEPEVFTIGTNFQDYMMHYIMRLANKRQLTMQFHTGLHNGNGNYIRNSDPSLLTNLFFHYPDVKFDIFHIGYPYQGILSVLAKNFPNVYIDMCWAHIISPRSAINALLEWIDTVPLNKISAFGGDFGKIDGVYGHQLMARQNISRALSIKVKEDLFDIERAKQIAKMLFFDNPKELFKL